MATAQVTDKKDLPPGINLPDIKYPGWSHKWTVAKRKAKLVVKTIDFYKTERFGWVVCVLHIRNPSRRSTSSDARSYAVDLDGELCTVGLGPHVLQRFTLHITNERQKDLQKYIDLYDAGAAKANNARDVRSTRMARGSLRRGRGIFGW